MTDFTQATGTGGQLKLSLTETSVDVAANQSTVRVTYQIYTPPGSFNANNNITVSLSGDVSWSSGSFGFTSAGGWHTLYDGYVTFTHDANGQKSIAVTASMGATGTSGVGGPASVSSGTFNLSDIVQAPTAPGAPTPTRVNDGQINLSWTNNSSTHHEYASQSVQRSTDGGAYATIATGLGAAATSYSDTATAANHKYTYKIVAVNAAGSATSSAGSATHTTPAADSGMTATKLAGGSIRVDWTVNSNYTDNADLQHDVYDSADGVSWTYKTSVFGSTATWTDTGPSTAVTHRYRTVTFPPSTSLYATSSASNIITLLSTASAPTGLSPSGVAEDAADAIALSWTHNPTDGTPQSKRHVQAKVNAGAYADLINDSSTTSSYTVAGGTWTNGDTITWKVATAGENGTLSSYSAEASFTLSTRPTVTISSPGSSYGTSSLTVSWAYYQPESSAQATYRAYLYANSGSTLVESGTGTTATSHTFAAALSDATAYTVKVYATSAAGLESLVASQDFTTSFLPPAAITVAGVFDDAAGFVVLTLTGAADVPGVTEPITTVDVQRKIDGGEWLTILTGVVLDAVTLTATVQDTVPITVGTNAYRAIAYSALPSSVMSAEDAVTTSETTWGYLSSGTRFGTVARFRAMPTYAASASRSKAVYHFAGRPKPVQLAGEALTATLSVSGKLSAGSGSAADFEAQGQTDGVVCWRGPDGRRVFASIDKVSTGTTLAKALPSVSFTLTEVDFTEGDQ